MFLFFRMLDEEIHSDLDIVVANRIIPVHKFFIKTRYVVITNVCKFLNLVKKIASEFLKNHIMILIKDD